MGLNVRKFNTKTFGNLKLHIDPEARKTHGHSNKDIDVTKTDDNYSFGCDTWDECSQKIKQRTADVDEKIPPQRIRKDRVIAVGTCIYIPDQIPKAQEREFFQYAYQCLQEKYGAENVHAGFVHVDEKHEYIDYKTGKIGESKNHMHVYMSPYTEKKGINGASFVTRNTLRELQFYMDKKVMERFGVHMLEYPNGNSPAITSDWSVEELKKNSQSRAVEITRRMEMAEKEMKKYESQLTGFLGQKKTTYQIPREDLEKMLYAVKTSEDYIAASREMARNEELVRERIRDYQYATQEYKEKSSSFEQMKRELEERSQYQKLVKTLERYIPNYEEIIEKKRRQEKQRQMEKKKQHRSEHKEKPKNER